MAEDKIPETYKEAADMLFRARLHIFQSPLQNPHEATNRINACVNLIINDWKYNQQIGDFSGKPTKS